MEFLFFFIKTESEDINLFFYFSFMCSRDQNQKKILVFFIKNFFQRLTIYVDKKIPYKFETLESLDFKMKHEAFFDDDVRKKKSL